MNTPAAALVAVLSLILAGCSAASVPPSPQAPASSPAASLAPDAPIAGDPGGNVGGGTGGGVDPGQPGQPTLVLPKPGQRDVREVSIEELSAKVAGRHVVLNARWWSGVEPCNVLDSVAVKRDGQKLTVSVREGTGDGDAMCIEIAMLKVTPIDLGELDPGVYTIVASHGGAPAITVTVT